MPNGDPPLADMDEIFDALVALDEVIESADIKVLALSKILFRSLAEDHVVVYNFFDFSAGIL